MDGTLRPVRVWQPDVVMEQRADGTLLVRQAGALPDYPLRLSDRIAHWARAVPDRPWMAERNDAAEGGWRSCSYGDLVGYLPRVGGHLLDLGLSVDRPLLILSGNGLDHAIAALSAQHVGIASAALAPAYSLFGGFGKLADIAQQITPGAIFVDDVTPFGSAIAAVFGRDIPVIAVRGQLPDREVMAWSDALTAPPTPDAQTAHERTGPDTVAKFLFTSGTTGSPKAVIQTQRMLCSNMEMVRDCYAFMADEPPVILDWAPWNHVASGIKVFNMALYNGGTFYIDGGKPTPDLIGETIRNLREIAPTWYFNVPVGYDALVEAMRGDTALRDNFFSRLKLLMYAGAGMAQHTWTALRELSVQSVGARTLLCTGLGATETAPFALSCMEEQDAPGNVGVPSKGMEMKLVPTGDKLELRVKGPNITPGYWRAPDLTAKAFDDEGYYCIGDAVRFAVPGDAAKGFVFDGRIAENFKLGSGTWVAVGTLRAVFVDAMGGLARDAVITGEGHDELGALIVPARGAFEKLVTGGAYLDDATLFTHPDAQSVLAQRLAALAGKATGSSMRIMRALVLIEPLDFARGEVTDKGSVNQRRVLAERAEAVEALYAGGAGVILVGGKQSAAKAQRPA